MDDRRSPSTVAITGASGFLGSAVAASLKRSGTRVLKLVRRPAAADDEVSWDPEASTVESDKLAGIDAVLHLAAESIAGVWTAAKKRRILESREHGTRLLATAIASLDRPPRALVSVSGIGYYGDAGDRVLTESAPPGDDFIARVCIAWEAATRPAANAGIRVVTPRMGLVLHPSGGALRVMLPAFRLGLGGTLGSGRQWLSWISLPDAVRVLRFAIEKEDLRGPVNAAAPEPVRNRDFTRAMGRAVGRPTIFSVPAFALRAATGGMAEALLLSSQRVIPQVLQDAGFRFELPSIGAALAAELDGNG